MLYVILKFLIFNFAFSFFMGLVLLLPALLMIPFIKDEGEKQSPLLLTISFILGAILILIQAFVVSRTVEISLLNDPTRFTFIWCLIGLVFSTPIAVLKSKGTNQYEWIGVPLSYVLFLVGFFTDFDNIQIINRIANILSV